MDDSFNAMAAMGERLRSWIVLNALSHEVVDGEVLIQEGAAETRLVVIEAGSALVNTTGQDGQQITLTTLPAGSLVGEMSLLEGRPPVASVIAGPGCRVIEIPYDTLQAATDGDPWLACEVNNLFARKLAIQLASQNNLIHRWHNSSVEPLRKALVVFAHLNEVDVEWLARLGQRRRHSYGSVLIRQGELVPELLLVLIGTASVSIASPAGAVEVGSSRAGELLGEMSLVGGAEKASATVTAVGPVEVLAIPKDQLLERLGRDPSLGARFYGAMALLLSQRNRDQLQSRGLAANARKLEALPAEDQSPESDLDEEESLDLKQMASISKAGQRFYWLCQTLGVSTGA